MTAILEIAGAFYTLLWHEHQLLAPVPYKYVNEMLIVMRNRKRQFPCNGEGLSGPALITQRKELNSFTEILM